MHFKNLVWSEIRKKNLINKLHSLHGPISKKKKKEKKDGLPGSVSATFPSEVPCVDGPAIISTDNKKNNSS